MILNPSCVERHGLCLALISSDSSKEGLVKMLRRSVLAFVFMAVFGRAAMATPITVDEILFDSTSVVNAGLLSGTVDMSYSGGVLTILLTNTSGDGAGSAAGVLLTGIGFQLPAGVTLTGGAAFIGASSTAVNFAGAAGTNISSEWGYDVNPLASGIFQGGAALTYNTVTSSMESTSDTRFATGSLGAPPELGGPDFGAISALETDAGGQEAIRDTIRITLNLSGVTGDIVSQIQAGNVGISFGSPDSSSLRVPEPSSLSLLVLGFGGALGVLRRRKHQA